MALDSILFGIAAVVAIISMIMLGILSYVLWKVGNYKRAVMCAVIVILMFLFFFGDAVGIGIGKCFGYC